MRQRWRHAESVDRLASCYDLISMLEHQLRTARALLDELRERRSPVTQTSMSLVVDYCAELRAEAVEVVKASEMLQGDVCGPVDRSSGLLFSEGLIVSDRSRSVP